MIEACHKLFQINKNPSDEEIEQAFKLQVQVNNPKKMQELISLDGWPNLWKASYSIVSLLFGFIVKNDNINTYLHTFF
jgi:hypothetical protein